MAMNWRAEAAIAERTWRGVAAVWVDTDGIRADLENGARIVVATVRTAWATPTTRYLAVYYAPGERESRDQDTFGSQADAMEYGRIAAASR